MDKEERKSVGFLIVLFIIGFVFVWLFFQFMNTPNIVIFLIVGAFLMAISILFIIKELRAG